MTLLDAVSNASGEAADLCSPMRPATERRSSPCWRWRGSAAHLPALDGTAPLLLKSVPEEFVTFDDAAALKEVLEKERSKNGSSFFIQIRRNSSSGTSLGLHESAALAGPARRWSRFIVPGAWQNSLVGLMNPSLHNVQQGPSAICAGLLEELCGPELAIIEVNTSSSWCLTSLHSWS